MIVKPVHEIRLATTRSYSLRACWHVICSLAGPVTRHCPCCCHTTTPPLHHPTPPHHHTTTPLHHQPQPQPRPRPQPQIIRQVAKPPNSHATTQLSQQATESAKPNRPPDSQAPRGELRALRALREHQVGTWGNNYHKMDDWGEINL